MPNAPVFQSGQIKAGVPVRDSIWIAAVLVLGVAGSLGMFHWVRQWDRERAELHLSLQAQATASAVRMEAEVCDEILHHLAELLGRRSDLSRADFADVARPILRRHPGLWALEWVPLVRAADRTRVEELATRELGRHFEFTQRKSPSELQRAADSAMHAPILYVEPTAGNERALGFDLTRGPTAHVLDLARDSGDLVLSPPIRLVQESEQQMGYVLIMPVYQAGKVPASRAERAARLIGFAQAVVRVGDFLRAAMKETPPLGLNLMVLDLSPGSSERVLTYVPAPSAAPAVISESAIRSGWHAEHWLTLGERLFALVFHPSAEAIAAASSWNPLGALSSGLLLTLGGTMYLRSQLRRTARVEAEVAARTTELTRANELLSAEVAARLAAERELARQLQLLRTVMDAIPDSIYIKDRDGRYLLHNAANRRLLKLPTGDDGTGRTAYDFASTKAHADAYTTDDRMLLQTGQPVINREERFTQDDGSTGWFLTTKVPVLNEAGELTGIVGVSRDISARRQEALALAESEARFRMLFENSPDAIFVESQAGIVLDVNPAAARLHGLPREALLGKHVTELVPPARQQEVRESFPRLFALETTLLEGESYTLDGRVIPVELAARRCEYRGQAAVLLHVRDSSERHEAALALQRRDRILQTVAHAARTLLHAESWQKVADGVVEELSAATEASAACLFANEMLGDELVFQARCHWPAPQENDPPFGPIGYRAAGCARWLELLARGETVHGRVDELPLSERAVPQTKGMQRIALTPIFADTVWWGFLAIGRTDASRVWSEMELEALRTAAEVFGAAIYRAEAEAEGERIQLKLQAAQKLESLGVLAGGIAHDFNNLLTSILGKASLARMDLPPDSPAEYPLQQIEATSQRAAELCRQMLAYAGKGRFVVQTQDLNRLIRDIIQLLRVSLSKKASIDLELAPEPLQVMADAAQVRQIVMNLVLNASEAIGDRPGRIRITTGVIRPDPDYFDDSVCAPEKPAAEYVLLRVQDDGCGMTAGVRARIFEPFFTTKFTGRGLGLSATLGIIRGHQGALKLESEPGQGSTFTLLLPRATGQPPEPEAPAATVPAWRGKGKILVVDDEAPVRHVACRALETLGFTTTVAQDGREAVELFAANPAGFTAVLMDLTMPRLNGLEAFAQMRQIHPSVRVVLMSGYDAQASTASVAARGLAGFLSKPFQLAELREQMRALDDLPPQL